MDSSYLYHLKTLYLFVENYRAVIIVWAVVGSLNAVSGLTFNPHESPSTISILSRFPLTLLHGALFALAFAVSNQHLPSAIIEDTGSKPWRPIPAGRISASDARVLFYVLALLNLLLSLSLGREVFGVMVIQLAFTLAYNDLGLSERGFWIRDFINAVGMTSWLVASSLVAAGPGSQISGAQSLRWFGVLTLVTYTTLSTVDFHDLAGDRDCGRITLPIWFGEEKARWIVGVLVTLWSALAPTLWSADGVSLGGLVTSMVGWHVAKLILGFGGKRKGSDAALRHWWYVWYGAVCLVPFMAGGLRGELR